ncbi:MAG: J domain-containing protein [Bdellovibrionales bacterium]
MSQTKNSLKSAPFLSFRDLLKAQLEEESSAPAPEFTLGVSYSWSTQRLEMQFPPRSSSDSLYERIKEQQRVELQQKREQALQRKKEQIRQERLSLSLELREAFEFFDSYRTEALTLCINEQQLKREYRKIAVLIHPDRFQNLKEKNRAHGQFLKLQQAYETLLTLIGSKDSPLL